MTVDLSLIVSLLHDIARARLHGLIESEREVFARENPRSHELAQSAHNGLFGGVPMHWMADWPTPFPLFVHEAKGAHFTDVDGHAYADFCLGDTGAMFGHAPPAVEAAMREQAGRGYTTMLPGEDAVRVGQELSQRFGLPYWQFTKISTSMRTPLAVCSSTICGSARCADAWRVFFG